MNEGLTYESIVARLAPCGLGCERCVMYVEGRVQKLAAGLGEALEGFEKMAPRVADRVPALAEYGRFLDVLEFFTQASCAGCRGGGSQLPFCAARTCHSEQGVDFCFECAEYPCNRNSYPENLAERWRSRNDRMRDVGVAQFYEESLGETRY